MRRGLWMLVGMAVLWPASAGDAYATVGSNTSWGPPKHGRQALTVTTYDDTGGRAVTLYVTYRKVDPKTTIDDACTPTMATNHDARLFDSVVAGPAPYSMTRSVSLPLGVYAVCDYSAYDASTVLAAAELVSEHLGGSYNAPRARRPTAIGLSLRQAGAHGRFTGAIAGTVKAKVLIQRRSSGRWQTVKQCRAIHTRFSTRASIRHGARYRARLVGTRTYAGSVSRSVRAR